MLAASLSQRSLGRATAGHSRRVRSELTEARRCPSGLKATSMTASVCPVRASPMGWRVSEFHKRIVWSLPAEASRCPSGLNATLSTESVCPVRGAPTGWRVSEFHNRTVLSMLAEASRCPSGLNARVHCVGVPGQGCADGLAGVGVPQPDRVVVAGRGQPVPVGARTPRCAPRRCARSGVHRWAGRCRRPTTGPCRRRWPRPAGARRG